MKLKNVFIAACSVALLASCGGSEMCDCAQTSLDAYNDMKDAKGDEAKIKELQESYKADLEACGKLMEEKEKEAGDDEAKQKALKEEMESCDAAKELEKLMKEDMGM